MAKLEEIVLPDLGEIASVEVIEILVAPGERIAPQQALLTVESDKASVEVPSPVAGQVVALRVKRGERIAAGAPLLQVALDTTEADSAAEIPDAAAPSAEVMSPPLPDAAPAVRPTGEAVPFEVRLPDIGDFKDVPVIDILVAVGDQVTAEQSLLTLESDKATLDIPAPRAGRVEAIAVKIGERLNRDDLLLTLLVDPTTLVESRAAEASGASASADGAPASTGQAGEPLSEARAPGERERRKAPVLPRPADMVAIAQGRVPHASPAVRRFARELGVDLARVKGSGRKERILKDDVQAYVKQALTVGTPAPASLPWAPPPAPEVDFARFGPIDSQPLSRIQRRSGAHLHRCWITVPHVTQFDEADITELEAFRKSPAAVLAAGEVKLTLLPFVLKAVATALARMPILKASLAADGERLILKQYCHLGVAVDTPDGLIVPVLRDVEQKGVVALASELAEVSARARAGKLLPADLQGGVFSISSLGGIGGTQFTPIVNAPEVAILGLSRAAWRPVWDGTAFVPRLLLPLSLSYDHRVVDGAEGARFTSLLAGLLGDVRQLLL